MLKNAFLSFLSTFLCFLVVILRWTASIALKFALSPPQAGVPAQTWVDWRLSSDGEISLQTLLDRLPGISHHWHLHAMEGDFFRACKHGNGDFIKVLLLPYQLCRVSASKTEQLFSWVSMKRLLSDAKVHAWRSLCLTPFLNLFSNAQQAGIWGQTCPSYTI